MGILLTISNDFLLSEKPFLFYNLPDLYVSRTAEPPWGLMLESGNLGLQQLLLIQGGGEQASFVA
jgi:hypothetical protein